MLLLFLVISCLDFISPCLLTEPLRFFFRAKDDLSEMHKRVPLLFVFAYFLDDIS